MPSERLCTRGATLKRARTRARSRMHHQRARWHAPPSRVVVHTSAVQVYTTVTHGNTAIILRLHNGYATQMEKEHNPPDRHEATITENANALKSLQSSVERIEATLATLAAQMSGGSRKGKTRSGFLSAGAGLRSAERSELLDA